MSTGCRQVRAAEKRRAHRRYAVPVLWIAVVTAAAMSVLVAPGHIEPASSSPSLPEENYPWSPVLEWEWTGGTVLPESHYVSVTPVVIDLDGDEVPEVVFVSHEATSTAGVLRAISGIDGREVFTVTDPAHNLNLHSGLAAGDIDNDGRPEIIAQNLARDRLVAFEHDGRYKWTSSPIYCYGNQAYPAIADVDHDGTPEIAICETLLNSDGTARWANRRPATMGTDTILVDLDLRGDLELVNGWLALRADGTRMWQTDIPGQQSAVADLDGDPYPEVVVTCCRSVYVAEHDGRIKWGPVTIPPGPGENRASDGNGAAVVGDFDGDCAPEIGFGTDDMYSVVETNGQVKWTKHFPAGAVFPGSSAADLNGDGAAEILFHIGDGLMILRGSDGAILWRVASSEYSPPPHAGLPVVADVDADGRAEIVSVWLDIHRETPGPAGIQVYGHDAWAPTRRVWNQKSYHITNVEDDGSIPRVEPMSWDTHNSFRVNAPTTSIRCRRIFLPITLREREQPVRLHGDIILVVDASESMAGTKLAAAKAAIRQFFGQMTWPDDRVAVVAFNRRAQRVHGLPVVTVQKWPLRKSW